MSTEPKTKGKRKRKEKGSNKEGADSLSDSHLQSLRSVLPAVCRSGSSEFPSRQRQFVSSSDRIAWNAKLDSSDVAEIKSVVKVDESGNVKLVASTTNLDIDGATKVQIHVGGIKVAESSAGQELDVFVPLVASNGIQIPLGENVEINGSISMSLSSSAACGAAISQNVLLLSNGVNFVNVFDIIILGSSVSFNAIDVGSIQNGKMLSIGMIPASSTELISNTAMYITPGFAIDGTPSFTQVSSTTAPVATATGTTVSVYGAGIIRFAFIPNFAGVTPGAWMQV